MVIYDYYKSIEGKNFNASGNYFKDYADEDGKLPDELTPHTLNEIAKCDSNIIYYSVMALLQHALQHSQQVASMELSTTKHYLTWTWTHGTKPC